jgi:hypothetical protein
MRRKSDTLFTGNVLQFSIYKNSLSVLAMFFEKYENLVGAEKLTNFLQINSIMFLRNSNGLRCILINSGGQSSTRSQPKIYIPSQEFNIQSIYPSRLLTKFYSKLNVQKDTPKPSNMPTCPQAIFQHVQPKCEKPWATLILVQEIRTSTPYRNTTFFLTEKYHQITAIKWDEIKGQDVVTAIKTYKYKQAASTFIAFVAAINYKRLFHQVIELFRKIPAAYRVLKDSKEYELARKILMVTWTLLKFLWRCSNGWLLILFYF